MVDENDSNTATENTEAEQPVTASEPKKQRAKRRTPAELAAVAESKSQKAKSKTKATPAEASKPTSTSKAPSVKSALKASPKSDATTRAEQPKSPSASVDDFAELLQLEEENKGLRKALSEKLRVENAELRKRLGQA